MMFLLVPRTNHFDFFFHPADNHNCPLFVAKKNKQKTPHQISGVIKQPDAAAVWDTKPFVFGFIKSLFLNWDVGQHVWTHPGEGGGVARMQISRMTGMWGVRAQRDGGVEMRDGAFWWPPKAAGEKTREKKHLEGLNNKGLKGALCRFWRDVLITDWLFRA